MNEKVRVIYNREYGGPGNPYCIQVKRHFLGIPYWYTRGIWNNEQEAIEIAKQYLYDIDNHRRVVFTGA